LKIFGFDKKIIREYDRNGNGRQPMKNHNNMIKRLFFEIFRIPENISSGKPVKKPGS
jgi:hypothetical protein